ncbi:hypothetical protein GCM10007977_089320 [Dactylosporangium sucinum]|uniref:Uncharacterized protein n=2 Tax=Dactylosporangium sucinum TaxID=1424081 RepID=A0A917X6D5_9ACTN|nr:hypothetical protein GCM10007977_089320 [Dactylosporangium sucinum]
MNADGITVPVLPRLVADDVTSEQAASLFAEQGGRLAVLSAEGGIFATLAGRYSGTPNLEVFLKGHAGDMLRVDRRSRPAEHVVRPALMLGLAVQPEVPRDIAPYRRTRSAAAAASALIPSLLWPRIRTPPTSAPWSRHSTAGRSRRDAVDRRRECSGARP